MPAPEQILRGCIADAKQRLAIHLQRYAPILPAEEIDNAIARTEETIRCLRRDIAASFAARQLADIEGD
jgi:hypothetical protein